MLGVYIRIFPDLDSSRGGITNEYGAWGSQAQRSAADWLHRQQRIHNRAWQFNKRVIIPSRTMRERDAVERAIQEIVAEPKPVQLTLWIPAPGNAIAPPEGYYPERIA